MANITLNIDECGTITTINYGLLYNWFAATDERKISSSDDWIVPNQSQWETLITYIGGILHGGKLKEEGLTRWDTPNAALVDGEGFPLTYSDNSTGFTFVGAGFRGSSGDEYAFSYFKAVGYCWFTDIDWEGFVHSLYIDTYSGLISYTGTDGFKTDSSSIRLLYTGIGTPTSYTGNDGKVYKTVTIGTQTWLADNLGETKFRNNDIIPWYGANIIDFFTNVEWSTLITAGCCAYNNDVNNVAPDFTFPIS